MLSLWVCYEIIYEPPTRARRGMMKTAQLGAAFFTHLFAQ